jgi:hypothetical protein
MRLPASRIVAAASLTLLLLILAGCGSTSKSSTSDPQSGIIGPLTGNWQLTLLQQEPRPSTQLSVSGFLQQSSNSLTGSVQGPNIIGNNGSTVNCAGISSLTGTISGQTVSFSVNPGGTTFNFTGNISPDFESMSGDYQALGGACLTVPLSGTWNAFLIPPLNGNFTGTITNSSYMAVLTGMNPAAPVTVSGTISQGDSAGASNATLTGTFSAVGYPCLTTASLTGTISGQNVYLDIFGYNGVQIGTLGQPGVGTTPGSPATVEVTSTGLSLVDASTGGLFLGAFTGVGTVGPCPSLFNGSSNQTSDSASVDFTFQ